MNDSDEYLLGNFKENLKKKNFNYNLISKCSPPSHNEFQVLDAEIFKTIRFDNLRAIQDAKLTLYSCNMIYHVGGSAAKSLRTKVCENCTNYITNKFEDSSVLNN